MTEKYRIKMTRLAQAFATKHGGVVAVEEQARAQLAELQQEMECSLNEKNWFHTLCMPGQSFASEDDTETFFSAGPFEDDEGFFVGIGVITYEEGPTLTKGPFAGKMVMIPTSDMEEEFKN